MTSDTSLSEDQRHQMLVTSRPEDNWPVHLSHTPNLEADYREWLNTECDHKTTELRKTVTKTGAVYVGLRCTHCDERMSDWWAKSKVPDPDALPVADADGPAKYDRKRRDAWKATQHKHLALQNSKLSAEYQAYLQSPAWRSIREQVMQRAHGRCEGCGLRAATQVHHLTYANIFHEFLWELAAVCDLCHDRVHSGIDAEK